ncbi:MAG: hypothetical protein A3A33_03280 [Candidatus Yanofskybacteria bacterium RIFCSPLOWO2_01_FULL_49_25]|uniref:Uncharacterized protein n=1 Tax=Candidatus Yanofskybacteria bacterium RIFCSPLOWO2_01_FULL_49_25 TaxID=1802701 RepID=A0A1F8GVR9_9BACT|nr:MAG: hypothetical protein A3A33_03280 [Candidatus Yanofskybacteria bacterium RIFCSPLOWO2_01_FULL_49_25]
MERLLQRTIEIVNKGSKFIGSAKIEYARRSDDTLLPMCKEVCTLGAAALTRIAISPLLSSDIRGEIATQVIVFFSVSGLIVDFALIRTGPLMAKTERELLETKPSLGDPTPQA